MLVSVLADQLDDHYILLKNYTPPAPWRSGGDLDAVLIGPNGVIVFEAKAWRGFFCCAGDEWYYRRSPRHDWEPAYGNPTAQVLHGVQRIQGTLRLRGFASVPVRPIIAITSDTMSVEIDNSHPLAAPLFFGHSQRARIQNWLPHEMPFQETVEHLWQTLLGSLPAKHP